MSETTVNKTASRIKPLPSVDRLNELLTYDPKTGVFAWKVSRGSRGRAGSVAGCTNGHGYWVIRIDGVQYLVHRLAWKMMVGSDPTDTIDHINNQRDDNRFVNLREATPSQQMQNKTAHGSSKYLGVHWGNHAKKWVAMIRADGKQRNLGYFACEIEAAKSYDAMARKHWGEYANLNFEVA